MTAFPAPRVPSTAASSSSSASAYLARARSETKGRFENYSRRIEALERGIPALLERVRKQRSLTGEQLQQMAVATLEQRKTLLHDYLIQARFGVASLLDSSSEQPAEGDEQ